MNLVDTKYIIVVSFVAMKKIFLDRVILKMYLIIFYYKQENNKIYGYIIWRKYYLKKKEKCFGTKFKIDFTF